MDIRTKIGGRIRELRRQKSMTIEDLAFKSGVHYNYLGDIERGARNPSIESLVKIANGIGVDVGEIFRGGKGGTVVAARNSVRNDDAYKLSRSIIALLKDKSPETRRFIVAMVKKLSKKIK